MTPREAFRVLGLDEALATEATVRVVYLARVQRDGLHPDQGGEAAAFARVAEAYRVATAHARARRAPCAACGGAGKVRVGRGWAKEERPCAACGGTGRAG